MAGRSGRVPAGRLGEGTSEVVRLEDKDDRLLCRQDLSKVGRDPVQLTRTTDACDPEQVALPSDRHSIVCAWRGVVDVPGGATPRFGHLQLAIDHHHERAIRMATDVLASLDLQQCCLLGNRLHQHPGRLVISSSC